jgi:hypothetical protein
VSYQLGNAKVWDGTQWVEAVGGGGFLYGDTIDTSDPVTFTCDATAHVKGAWVEAVASTTSEANQLFLTVYNINVNGQATGTLIDVGIGAAGSEVVVAENIAVGGANLNDPRMQFPLFVNVPTLSLAVEADKIYCLTATVQGGAGTRPSLSHRNGMFPILGSTATGGFYQTASKSSVTGALDNTGSFNLSGAAWPVVYVRAV